jgi:hypothetical protein
MGRKIVGNRDNIIMVSDVMTHRLSYTSRKHGKKEPQSCSHCGSFLPPCSAITKRMHICFLGLPTEILRILGLLLNRYRGLENIFPTVYYMPLESQNCNRKIKKTNMQSVSDCRSGWSKEPQWKYNCGSFLLCFLLVLPQDLRHFPYSFQQQFMSYRKTNHTN